tara:strand:- start:1457 stop:1972 length:516 start_codon:yes stop_codon:yes gene_type:complete
MNYSVPAIKPTNVNNDTPKSFKNNNANDVEHLGETFSQGPKEVRQPVVIQPHTDNPSTVSQTSNGVITNNIIRPYSDSPTIIECMGTCGLYGGFIGALLPQCVSISSMSMTHASFMSCGLGCISGGLLGYSLVLVDGCIEYQNTRTENETGNAQENDRTQIVNTEENSTRV